MGKILTVLIVGATPHAEAYGSILCAHPRFELIGVAEESEAPAPFALRHATIAKRLGVEHIVGSAEAIASSPADVVLVATEPARRLHLAQVVLQASKHLLLDKPLATNSAEVTAIAAEARGSGMVATYVHRCLSPPIERTRQRVASGSLGLPRFARLVFVPTFQYDWHDPVNAVLLDANLSGGGELINFLGYPVDYLRYITGLEVRSVFALATAMTSVPHAVAGVESFALVSLGLDHGAVALITVGRSPAAGHPAGGSLELHLLGSEGTIRIDETRPALAVHLAAGAAPNRPLGGGPGVGSFTRLLDDLGDAIETGCEPVRTLDDGTRVARVIDAAYASATGRCTIDLSSDVASPTGPAQ